MRNYRQIMDNRNLTAWGSGKSQADGEEPIIYDIAYLDESNQSYTVLRDGVIFYIGAERKSTVFPNDFETIISCSVSEERNSPPIILTYQLNVVKKMNVRKNDILNFDMKSISGILILTESNTNVTDFLAQKGLVSQKDGSINFYNNSYFQGFGFLSYILSSTTTNCIENPQSKLKYSMITNNPNTRGNALYVYNQNIDFKLFSYDGIRAANLVLMKIQKGKSEVSYIEKLGISIERNVANYDFIPRSINFISTLNGYIIFVGAYRENESFLLNGFTVVKESQMHTNGVNQTLFVAYKKVYEGEVIWFDPKERFGGTIYSTYSDINDFNIRSGNGVKTTLKDKMLFPVATDLSINFGIAGLVNNSHKMSYKDNTDLVRHASPTDGRLVNFVTNDYFRSYTDIIEIEDSINTSIYPDDLDGIWVEFSPK